MALVLEEYIYVDDSDCEIYKQMRKDDEKCELQ